MLSIKNLLASTFSKEVSLEEAISYDAVRDAAIKKSEREIEAAKKATEDAGEDWWAKLYEPVPEEDPTAPETNPGFEFRSIDPKAKLFDGGRTDLNKKISSIDVNHDPDKAKAKSKGLTYFLNDYLAHRGVFYKLENSSIYRANSNGFTDNRSLEQNISIGNIKLAQVISDTIEVGRQTPYIKAKNILKPVTIETINGGLRYGAFRALFEYVIIIHQSNKEGDTYSLGNALGRILKDSVKKMTDLEPGARDIMGELLRTCEPRLSNLKLPKNLLEASERSSTSVGKKSDEEFINSNMIESTHKAVIMSILDYYLLDTNPTETLVDLCSHIKRTLQSHMSFQQSPSSRVIPKERAGSSNADALAGGMEDWEALSRNPELRSTDFELPGDTFVSNAISDASKRGIYNGDQVASIDQIDSLSKSKLSGNALLAIFYQLMSKVEATSTGMTYKYPLKSGGVTTYETIHKVLEIYIEYLKQISKDTGSFPEDLLSLVIVSNKNSRRSTTETILENDPKKILKNIMSDKQWLEFPTFLLRNTDLTKVKAAVRLSTQTEEVVIKPAQKKVLGLTNNLPGLKMLLFNKSGFSQIKGKILSQYSTEIEDIISTFRNINVKATRDKADKFKELLDKYFNIASLDAYWVFKSDITKRKLPIETIESETLALLPSCLGLMLLDVSADKRLVEAQLTNLYDLSEQLFKDVDQASDEDTAMAHVKTREVSNKENIEACLETFSSLLTQFTNILPPYTTRLIKALNYSFYKIIILGEAEEPVQILFNSLYDKKIGDDEYDTKSWPVFCLDINNDISITTFNALEEVIKISSGWNLSIDNPYLDDTKGEKYFGTRENYHDFLSNTKAIFPDPWKAPKLPRQKRPQIGAIKEGILISPINDLRSYLLR